MDKVSKKYSGIGIFNHLAKFCDSRINDKIRNFINHKDYLTATTYNARISLGLDTVEINKREQIKRNRNKKMVGNMEVKSQLTTTCIINCC